MKSTFLAAIFSIALVCFGSTSGANAQLVFDKSDVDGSFGQGSILNAGDITYGAQPFVVTAGLVSANAIQYAGAFTTDAAIGFDDDSVSELDVRTWNDGLIFISTAEDVFNGTPTAQFKFNPLMSYAPNGQTYSELVTTELGSNGQTLHTFSPVADLGFSTDGNPYHQITVPLSGTSQFTLNDSSTVLLRDLLANHLNETLFISSVISNAASDGVYEIAATDNLGTEGLLFRGVTAGIPSVFEVSAGFAHLLLAVTVPVLGDFNNDGDVDCDDLDGYVGNLGADATGMLVALDIDSDGTLTQADVDTHITTLIETTNGQTGTFLGDLNCDGQVSVLGDAFALIGSLGQSVSSYSDGDLNFDGEVTVLGDAFILIGNLGSSNTANASQSGQ